MKAVSRYAGLVGILCLLGAGLGYALAAFMPIAYIGPLVLGTAGLIVYAVYHVKEIQTFFFRTSRVKNKVRTGRADKRVESSQCGKGL